VTTAERLAAIKRFWGIPRCPVTVESGKGITEIASRDIPWLLEYIVELEKGIEALTTSALLDYVENGPSCEHEWISQDVYRDGAYLPYRACPKCGLSEPTTKDQA